MVQTSFSVISLIATSYVADAISIAARAVTPLQSFDSPYLANDSSYFPTGSTPWINPNSSAPARTSGDIIPFLMADCYGLPLEEATIDEMQSWMSTGKLTSRELTLCFLGRILQLNDYVKYGFGVNLQY
jgi:hypothetical protein